MSDETDDCRALISPEPDGRYMITLRRIYGYGENPERVFMTPRDIQQRYDVRSTDIARTEERARRKASKMLGKLRAAKANSERGDRMVSS